MGVLFNAKTINLNKMLVDHSKTYRFTDVKNLAHILRLLVIRKTLKSVIDKPVDRYADFGCSNGFVTDIVAKEVDAANVFAFDCNDNIENGKKMYPRIRFDIFDLNAENLQVEKYNLVTCFETLEHVGNIRNAVQNIVGALAGKGCLIITVPIEISVVGFLKYIIKRCFYRYDFPLECREVEYVKKLIFHERIGVLRKPAECYGSHFGFDYRDVDDVLNVVRDEGMQVEVKNIITTRFYICKKT